MPASRSLSSGGHFEPDPFARNNRLATKLSNGVMAGLVPAIHVFVLKPI